MDQFRTFHTAVVHCSVEGSDWIGRNDTAGLLAPKTRKLIDLLANAPIPGKSISPVGADGA